MYKIKCECMHGNGATTQVWSQHSEYNKINDIFNIWNFYEFFKVFFFYNFEYFFSTKVLHDKKYIISFVIIFFLINSSFIILLTVSKSLS